jgi:hypothetical protein
MFNEADRERSRNEFAAPLDNMERLSHSVVGDLTRSPAAGKYRSGIYAE